MYEYVMSINNLLSKQENMSKSYQQSEKKQ